MTRSSRRRVRAATIGAAIAFAGVASVLVYRIERNLNIPGKPMEPAWALMDFRDTVYYPMRALLDGRDPWDAVTYGRRYPVGYQIAPYLPAALLLGVPFAVLPYERAEAAYVAVMLVLAVAMAGLLLVLCDAGPTTAATLGAATVLLASRPGQMNGMLGQATLVYVGAAFLALGLARRRPALAAAALAVSAAKPTLGVPVAMLLAAHGELGIAIAGLALVGAASLAVVACAIDAPSIAHVVDLMRRSYVSFSAYSFNQASTSLFRVDTGALVGRLAGTSWGLAGAVAIAAAVLGIASLTMRRLRHANAAPERNLAMVVACLATLLCAYHQSYDLLLLAWPIAALAIGPWPSWAARARVPLLALLLFPCFNYLTTETTVAALGASGSIWVLVASLNGLALTTAFAYCVLLARRAPEPAQGSAARDS